jgi:pheromone shutdown protein TraB
MLTTNYDDINENLIESLKENGLIESLLIEFENEFPGLPKILIDERDMYMSHQILEIINKSDDYRKKIEEDINNIEKSIKKFETNNYFKNYTKNIITNIIDNNIINKKKKEKFVQNIIYNVIDKSYISFKKKLIINNTSEMKKTLQNKNIVVVIGKGHLKGINYYLNNKDKINIEETLKIEKNNNFKNFSTYFSIILILIILFFLYKRYL